MADKASRARKGDRAWSEWLKTPEADGYRGWCSCEWCHEQRKLGHEYVARKLAEADKEAS